MSFFEKLKKDIGLAEEEEKEKEVKPKKKASKADKKKEKAPPPPAETSAQEEDEKKMPPKAKANKEKPKKISVSLPKPKKEPSDWLKSEGQLAVDVYQTDSDFCVQAPIAGVEPDNIEISIENNMLVIKGERKESYQEKEKNYFYQECYWGSFSRKIILPEDIDTQRTKASLKKGILTIKIPRIRRTKKKKVTVQSED